ncbi:MAG: flagellar motor protein MotA [Proteobacteria bacterium]|nr:flagellar motor protein MotA [Pseudomonadota bacterium]
MTRPTIYLIRMGIFLGVVAALAAILSFTLFDAFRANIGLNGVILLVLLWGIIHSFRNVASLGREVTWIESFRRDQAAVTSNISPRLLSPMATMLGERAAGRFSLSTTAMRTLLDGIWSRLDERRELARYLIGLLVFLGLLGTFWGLLETVRSIGGVIASLSVAGGGDVSAGFEQLKAGLQEPLAGMGTAFSSSLFGLAGSLIVGFLELQAGQAQNRFYNDLEEWLSGLTKLSSGGIGTEGDASVPAYIQALLEKTADSLERLERIMSQSEGTRDSTDRHLQKVADNLDKLGDSPALQNIDQTLTRMSQDTAQGRNQLLEELRGEIRLLARTIAAAAGQSKQ